MIGKALDSNNDIILQTTGFQVVDKGANTVQHVKTNLMYFLGEWFLNRSTGVPYFTEIFTKPTILNRVESVFKSTILNTQGVRRLISFSLTLDKNERTLTVDFEAETIYDEIIGATINV